MSSIGGSPVSSQCKSTPVAYAMSISDTLRGFALPTSIFAIVPRLRPVISASSICCNSATSRANLTRCRS
nr:MAG TPA: hypothetical protein [Caudoviricetes sp.]